MSNQNETKRTKPTPEAEPTHNGETLSYYKAEFERLRKEYNTLEYEYLSTHSGEEEYKKCRTALEECREVIRKLERTAPVPPPKPRKARIVVREEPKEPEVYENIDDVEPEPEAPPIQQYTPKTGYTLFAYLHEISKLSASGESRDEAINQLLPAAIELAPKFMRIVTGKDIIYVANLSEDDPFAYPIKITSKGHYGGSRNYGPYISYIVKGKEKIEQLPPFFFLQCPARRITAERFVSKPYHYDLGYADTKSCNTFRGLIADYQPELTYERAVRICKPFLDHIKNVVCSGNETYYNYVLEWLVYPLRELKKTDTMLVLIGPQGAGKTIIFAFLRDYVTGKEGSVLVPGLERITGKFNKTLENKLYVCVNETANVSDGSGLSLNQSEILKELITAEMTLIEPKGVDAYSVDSYASYALTTNSRRPLIVPKDDRRYFILNTGEDVRPREYFDLLRSTFTKEMGDAFYTMARLSRPFYHDLRDIPMTPAKEEAIEASKIAGTLFFNDVFSAGTWPLPKHIVLAHSFTDEKEEQYIVSNKDLYEEYKRWHDETGNGKRWSNKAFTNRIAEDLPALIRHDRVTTDLGKQLLVYEISETLYKHVHLMSADDDKVISLQKLADGAKEESKEESKKETKYWNLQKEKGWIKRTAEDKSKPKKKIVIKEVIEDEIDQLKAYHNNK